MKTTEIIKQLRNISNMRSTSTYKRTICKMAAQRLEELAAYEDTGLKPEQARKIKEEDFELMNLTYGPVHKKIGEWIQAERDGRLVVLPCKVGDIVWTNNAMSGWYLREKNKPYQAKVVFIGLNDAESMGHGLFNVLLGGERGLMMQFAFSDIGKSVFLTREEAEAALEARKGGEEE